MKVSLLGLLLLSTVIHAGSGSKVCTDPATGRQLLWRDDYTAYNQCMKQNHYNAQAAHARCVAEPACRDRLIDKERNDRLFFLTMAAIVFAALIVVYHA
jgi:hypothetical protein